MKKLLFVIPLFALLFYGCENVSEPIDIESGVIPAFVIIESNDGSALPGGSFDVVFQLGQTQEENVIVDYVITGNAEEGVDYNVASGDGSTVIIEHDPETTSLDRGTLSLNIPETAGAAGTVQIVIELVSATTESGEVLTVGRGDTGMSVTYTVGRPQEGTYISESTGSFGAMEGSFEITEPDEPIVVEGVEYQYVTSDIASMLFGVPVPYSFNLGGDGTVIGAPYSHEPGFQTVILDVGGSFNVLTNTIVFDIVFQCCGVDGANLVTTGVLQQ